VNDETARTHYMELPGFPIQDYEFSGHHMTCKNHKGEDISIYLNADVLGLLKLKLDVGLNLHCILGLKVKVKVDVDVNVGGGRSIHDGCTKYLKSMDVVTRGMTGCQHVATGINHIDERTGLVELFLDLNAHKHNLLCGLLNGLLGDINAKVDLRLDVPLLDIIHGRTHEVISECDTYTDVPSIHEAIAETETKITEAKGKATEHKTKVETLLKEAEEAAKEFEEIQAIETEAEEEGETLETVDTTDFVKKAKQCVETITSKTKKTQKEYMASLEHYRQAIETAEMESAICKKTVA